MPLRYLRRIEARCTWRRATVRSVAGPLRLVRSCWWDDTRQEDYDRDIRPYFAPLAGLRPEVVVDAGAAGGLFAMTMARKHSRVRVFCFEPSTRQRALLRRNIRLNGLTHRVDIEPFGLWSDERTALFRTRGAVGTVRAAGARRRPLPFRERVRLTSLDAWAARRGVDRIDLIKLAVEGSELEALRGSRDILTRLRPRLLVQACGRRADEGAVDRLTDMLREFGYECAKIDPPSGLLFAVWSGSGAGAGRGRRGGGASS